MDGDPKAYARAEARKRLAELAITREALSERAGVTRNTVAAFLDGPSWPRADTLARIERALGWEIGRITELIEGQDTPSPVGITRTDGGDSHVVTSDVVIAFPPGTFSGLTDTEVEEVVAATKAAGLARLREIKAHERQAKDGYRSG